MIRLSVLDLPTLPPTAARPHLSGGAPVAEFVDCDDGRAGAGHRAARRRRPGLALGTAQGVVKRVTTGLPRPNKDLGGRRRCATATASSAPSTLHDRRRGPGASSPATPSCCASPRRAVRPQGRAGRWDGRHPAGRRARGRSSSVRVDPAADNVVVTVGRLVAALPGTEPGLGQGDAVRRVPAPRAAAPAAFAATGSCAARTPWCSPGSARSRPGRPRPTASPLDLPEATGKRDGSGTAYPAVIAGVGAPVR